jgi:hypothetical protein
MGEALENKAKADKMGEALNKAKADKRFEVVRRRSLIVDAIQEVRGHMHAVGRAANK